MYPPTAVRRGHIHGAATWRMFLKQRQRRLRFRLGVEDHTDQWAPVSVLYNNHSPKMYRYKLGVWNGRTDGQMDE